MMQVLFLTVALIGSSSFLPGVMMVSAAGSHQHLCSVDSAISKEFPATTNHTVRSLRDGRRFLVAAFQDDKPLDDDAQGYNLMNDTSPAVTFYKCVCTEPNFQDARTTHSYCPLHYVCAIPWDKTIPAKCMANSPLVSTARMAWPLVFTCTLCLSLVLFSSMHGLAIVKYGRKLWQLWCCRCCFTREGIDRLEQEEVDELLQFHRSRPPQEAPCRWRIQKYQLYHYQTTILSGAIGGWRREWRNLGTSIELYLATKAYQEDTLISADNSDGNNITREVSTLIPPDLGAEDGDEAKGNNDNIDDDDKMCSICFAEFQSGERLGDLPCSHDFHAQCLKTWIIKGRRNTCPLCQAPNMARLRE